MLLLQVTQKYRSSSWCCGQGPAAASDAAAFPPTGARTGGWCAELSDEESEFSFVVDAVTAVVHVRNVCNAVPRVFMCAWACTEHMYRSHSRQRCVARS